MKHKSQWKKDLSSRYTLAFLFFHYTPVLGEASPMSDGLEEKSDMSEVAKENRVWDPILEPSQHHGSDGLQKPLLFQGEGRQLSCDQGTLLPLRRMPCAPVG